jgi:RNA polymerase sigma-70 factor (ECF subfamily)
VSGDGPESNEDRALVERCFAHERRAWTTFVERFSRLIYSVVHETMRRHGASRDADEVDELFHTTFLALYDHNYRRLRQWSGRCSLASWVRLVTSSVVVDQLRRRRNTTPIDTGGGSLDGPLPDYLVDDARPTVEILMDAERAMRLRVALKALSPADRELLLLLYRDERTPGDVAALLDVRPGALYTRKNRALQRLREAVEGLPDDVGERLGPLDGEIAGTRASLGATRDEAPGTAPTTSAEGADGHPRRQ